MGTFNLTVTYADADGPEILAALQAYYATDAVPTPTLAQIRTILQNETIVHVRDVVKGARQKAAAAAVPTPNIS